MARQPEVDQQDPPKMSDLIDKDADGNVIGFRVVVERTICGIEFGRGELSPAEAAFAAIARQAEEGTYRFPNEDQGHVTVTVEWTP